MRKFISFALMALFSTSLWATDYPGIADTTVHVGSTTNPGAAKKFRKYCDGLYLYRANNGSHSYSSGSDDNKGIKIQNTQSGLVFYLEKEQHVYAILDYNATSSYPTAKVKLYEFSSTKYESIYKGTENSTVVDLASSDTTLQDTKSLTFTQKGLDTVVFENVAAGFYYIYGTTTSSNTYFTKIKFETTCDAQTPGAITKGALNEGYLTLIVSGTPAENNVWYWQASATGTSTGTPYSALTPRQVNAAGTYYLRSYYNNSCWGEASSITISAADLVANYTVIYKDGETTLGSETVEQGKKPTATGITTTKDFYAFAAWQLSGVDKALTDDSWASVAAEATVTLNARWTALYTSGSYVFENNATVGTNPSKTVTTTATDYDAFRVDNIYFDPMKIQYESGIWTSGDDDFKGWKIKTASAKIRFMVENNSQITARVGTLTSGCNIKYTPITGEETTTALTAMTSNKYNVKAGTIVTLTTQGSSTVNLKQIAVVPVYTVICADADNGSVAADKIYALEGETITLTLAPDAGYKVASVAVNSGDPLEVSDNTATFTMPADNANVVAVFTVTTSLDNTTSELNAIKHIENGQLIIEKNGVRYNAQGQLIR